MEGRHLPIGAGDRLLLQPQERSADNSTIRSQTVDTISSLTTALRGSALTPYRPDWIETTSNIGTVAVWKLVVNFGNTVYLERSHKNFVQYLAWLTFNSSLYSRSQISTVAEKVLTESEDTGIGQHVRVCMVWVNCGRKRVRERENERYSFTERVIGRESQRDIVRESVGGRERERKSK